MAIRHPIINGSQKVWLARVAYQGRRRAKVCRTKEEALGRRCLHDSALDALARCQLDDIARRGGRRWLPRRERAAPRPESGGWP